MSANRGHILYLTAYYPPANEIACIRTGNTSIELARNSWKVSVITQNTPLWQKTNGSSISEEPCLFIMRAGDEWRTAFTPTLRKLIHPFTFIQWRLRRRLCVLSGKCDHSGWYTKACNLAISESSKCHFDAILATGGPYGTFECAVKLKEHFNCKLILDYRDLWTTNNPHISLSSRKIAQMRESECQCIKAADAVLVVSPGMFNVLTGYFDCAYKTYVVPNGFNSEELRSVAPLHFKDFSVVYAGGLYPPKRTVQPIADAFALASKSDTDFSVHCHFHYFGPNSNLVKQSFISAGNTYSLIDHGQVSRNEALSAVAGADICAVVTTISEYADTSENGILTGKIYEPLGLGTPILLISPRSSDAAELVLNQNAGVSFSGNQIAEIASYLTRAFHSGKQQHRENPSTSEYNWSTIGTTLSSIISSTLDG